MCLLYPSLVYIKSILLLVIFYGNILICWHLLVSWCGIDDCEMLAFLSTTWAMTKHHYRSANSAESRCKAGDERTTALSSNHRCISHLCKEFQQGLSLFALNMQQRVMCANRGTHKYQQWIHCSPLTSHWKLQPSHFADEHSVHAQSEKRAACGRGRCSVGTGGCSNAMGCLECTPWSIFRQHLGTVWT